MRRFSVSFGILVSEKPKVKETIANTITDQSTRTFQRRNLSFEGRTGIFIFGILFSIVVSDN
jgi:hypothetical protein